MPNYRSFERRNAQPVVPWDYGKGYTSALSVEGITTSTPYVLVDLDDPTNFPHHEDNTEGLILKGVRISIERLSSGAGDVYIGVITENDDVDGTAQWLHRINLETGSAPLSDVIPFNNLDLTVKSGALRQFVSNFQQASHVNWAGGTAVVSPTSAGTAFPGVGDLVAWVELAGGTMDILLSVDYDSL